MTLGFCWGIVFTELRNWKGGEEKDMDKKSIKPSIKSSMLRAGKKTYFFDVKLSQNNKKYLKITESSFEGEGKERSIKENRRAID